MLETYFFMYREENGLDLTVIGEEEHENGNSAILSAANLAREYEIEQIIIARQAKIVHLPKGDHHEHS